MSWLYSILIRLYGLFIHIASIQNSKARRWIRLRRSWRSDIKTIGEKYPNPVLIHCASVGEYEQAKPIIKKIIKQYEGIHIVISFYSPSGYDQFDNYADVEAIGLLPLDTTSNAHEFLKTLNPRLVIFIKYDFWYNFITTLNALHIPTYFVAVHIHKDHLLKKPSMGFLRKELKKIKGIYVQDQKSYDILSNLGFTNLSISGDPRIGRVGELRNSQFIHPEIERLKRSEICLVAGSTHPKDEKLLRHLREMYPDHLMIIAPHVISRDSLRALQKDFGGDAILYSELSKESHGRTVIVDTYGDLKYLYRYGDIAYVGGGFDTGIHNLLEPAIYGLNLIFGPKFQKFPEASLFLDIGIAHVVNTKEDIEKAYSLAPSKRDKFSETLSIDKYLQENKNHISQFVNLLEL